MSGISVSFQLSQCERELNLAPEFQYIVASYRLFGMANGHDLESTSVEFAASFASTGREATGPEVPASGTRAPASKVWRKFFLGIPRVGLGG